jgi:isopentenyldiphosphate isomerase
VFNGKGELLVQLRGRSKDRYPLHWDVSVGGHVDPAETYDEAARRELHEELGLDGTVRFLRKTAASARTGWEFTCLYSLTTDQPVRPNRDEIVQCEFSDPATLRAEIREGARRATPALEDALAFHLDEEDLER